MSNVNSSHSLILVFFTLTSGCASPFDSANFIPTSLMMGLYTITLTIQLLRLKVKLPIPFTPDACADSHPAYGAAPAAVDKAVNLPTVPEVLIPVLNGFTTFSYPNPPPFSKLAKDQVDPFSPDSNEIGAFCENPIANKRRKKVKVIFFIILVV